MKTRGRFVIALVVALTISVGWAQNQTKPRRDITAQNARNVLVGYIGLEFPNARSLESTKVLSEFCRMDVRESGRV
jgi:hypothetical protein